MLHLQAYKAGFYGDHIVMVFMNWLDADWYTKANNCTEDEMLAIMDNSLFTGPTFMNPKQEPVCLMYSHFLFAL